VRSDVELDRLLGPIALYPDPLTAEILPAATVMDQLAAADRYVRFNGDLSRVDYEPWDESVKGLTRYPEVLRFMVENPRWTSDVGLAFVNQPVDVMESIQRLRAQARALGNLQSTPEQLVIVENRTIVIVPANPQVIYVPVYQPEVVYVQRPPAPGRFHVVFRSGRPVGRWLNHDLDWRDHDVIVWHADRPRPRQWWYETPSERRSSVVVNNNVTINNQTTVNQNYTVWQPRTPNNNPHWTRDRSRGESVTETRSTRTVEQPTQQPAPPSRVTTSPPAPARTERPTAGETRPRSGAREIVISPSATTPGSTAPAPEPVVSAPPPSRQPAPTPPTQVQAPVTATKPAPVAHTPPPASTNASKGLTTSPRTRTSPANSRRAEETHSSQSQARKEAPTAKPAPPETPKAVVASEDPKPATTRPQPTVAAEPARQGPPPQAQEKGHGTSAASKKENPPGKAASKGRGQPTRTADKKGKKADQSSTNSVVETNRVNEAP
jgi:hypothetical protein